MPTARPLLLALLALGVACGDDKDPLETAGITITSLGMTASGPTSASGSASASASASGTGEMTTGDPTTGGEMTTGGGGGETGKAVCDRWIECVAVTSPTELPDAQAGFGDDSPCWSSGPDDAELCVTACQTALDQAHEAFPTEEKCYACLTDATCAEGERCLKGGCTTTNCGDGVVDADEICDVDEGCDLDCQGPGECNPLSSHGCSDFEACYLNLEFLGEEPVYIGQCYEGGFDEAGFGEGCGEVDPNEPFSQISCTSGLACVPESEANFNCDLEACCVPYCDLGAPPACPMNFKCVAWSSIFGGDPNQYPLDPSLSWLGVCVP